MEDKVQKQQPADNFFFFRVHGKQIPCVDRMEKAILFCVSEFKRKKKNDFYVEVLKMRR